MELQLAFDVINKERALEIARELDISIHMDSALNQGTTFTLIFPCLADTAR